MYPYLVQRAFSAAAKTMKQTRQTLKYDKARGPCTALSLPFLLSVVLPLVKTV